MAASRNRLSGRRIVPQSVDGPQRGKASRLNEFHLHPPVLAVTPLIFWSIAEDVLILELHTDFRGDVWQLVGIIDSIGAAASLFGEIVQQSGPHSFFRCPAPRGGRFENSDRVYLHIAFANR